MSRPKDPKDVAIAFVMSAPLEVASAFVSTLASVVKARAAQKTEKPPAKVSEAAKPRAARAPLREVKIVDPNAPVEQQQQASRPSLLGEHPATN